MESILEAASRSKPLTATATEHKKKMLPKVKIKPEIKATAKGRPKTKPAPKPTQLHPSKRIPAPLPTDTKGLSKEYIDFSDDGYGGLQLEEEEKEDFVPVPCKPGEQLSKKLPSGPITTEIEAGSSSSAALPPGEKVKELRNMFAKYALAPAFSTDTQTRRKQLEKVYEQFGLPRWETFRRVAEDYGLTHEDFQTLQDIIGSSEPHWLRQDLPPRPIVASPRGSRWNQTVVGEVCLIPGGGKSEFLVHFEDFLTEVPVLQYSKEKSSGEVASLFEEHWFYVVSRLDAP